MKVVERLASAEQRQRVGEERWRRWVGYQGARLGFADNEEDIEADGEPVKVKRIKVVFFCSGSGLSSKDTVTVVL